LALLRLASRIEGFPPAGGHGSCSLATLLDAMPHGGVPLARVWDTLRPLSSQCIIWKVRSVCRSSLPPFACTSWMWTRVCRDGGGTGMCAKAYTTWTRTAPLFLRPASGADASRAVAPFSTEPCASRGHRARLSWDERFLVLEGLHAGALLLVEVVDGDAEETHSAPLAWGFLLVDAALERSGFRHPVRLQMHRCLGAGPVRLLRNWILGPATDQSEDLEKAEREQRTAPRIFHHYSLALRRLETAGWRSWMLAALAQVSGERQTAPATLEISLWREDTAEFAELVVDCDTHAQSGGAHQPPQQ